MLRSRPRKHSSAANRAFHREQRTASAGESQDVPPEATNTSKLPTATVSEAANGPSTHSPSLDADVDELASTMSALKFVPPSVRFGRGGRRGGFSRS